MTGSSRSGLRTISAHTSTSAMTFMIPGGRFPIEIQTKIQYLIICGYHNFMNYEKYLILVSISIGNRPSSS